MKNLEELNHSELKLTNGGFLFIIGVVSYVATTALIAGTVVAAGKRLEEGIKAGYEDMN